MLANLNTTDLSLLVITPISTMNDIGLSLILEPPLGLKRRISD